jgi:hypothetical protein
VIPRFSLSVLACCDEPGRLLDHPSLDGTNTDGGSHAGRGSTTTLGLEGGSLLDQRGSEPGTRLFIGNLSYDHTDALDLAAIARP